MKIKTKKIKKRKGGMFKYFSYNYKSPSNIEQKRKEEENKAALIEKKQKFTTQIKKRILDIINLNPILKNKLPSETITNLQQYYYTIRNNMYLLNEYQYYMLKVAEETKNNYKDIEVNYTDNIYSYNLIHYDNDNKKKYLIQNRLECRPLKVGNKSDTWR